MVRWLSISLLTFACSGEGEVLPPASGSADDPETSGAAPAAPLDEVYAADCDGYTEKLRDCGVLGAGRFDCIEPMDEQEACAFDCLAVASCGHLADMACSGALPGPLDQCVTPCFSFTCDDGKLIPSAWQCDAVADCFGGADEEGCPTFECDSGELIPMAFRCDLVAECPDASDEIGCPSFTCGTGEVYPLAFQCDLDPDCPDGSDEEGCGYFECHTTGNLLPPDWECDQVEDCLDGSDEFGCARFQCR